jgi:hypothetical protein
LMVRRALIMNDTRLTIFLTVHPEHSRKISAAC